MPRLPLKPVAELAEYDEMFHHLEGLFGFIPNDYLTMGHKPVAMKAVVDLTTAVMLTPGKTSMQLRLEIMYIASRLAGCMYCVAHTASLGAQVGIPLEKLHNIHAYETHPAFSPEERAALRVADKANKIPNQVSDQDFVELRKYFDDEGIAEIVAHISLMSFYNKWNDTLATTLEKPPLEMASRDLPDWRLGKHIAAAVPTGA
jgi:alkylhydroperoxidase family enzyme